MSVILYEPSIIKILHVRCKTPLKPRFLARSARDVELVQSLALEVRSRHALEV
jgi:hypothetical protein